MLTNVWDGFDYYMDLCHVSGGGHIEHFWTLQVLHVKLYIQEEFLNLPQAFMANKMSFFKN